jgi:Cellulose biosynthesis protein BcsS
MGAVGGYVDHIKGNATESIFNSAYGLEDNVLPYLDTVGELQGMNGFGGIQFGYTYAADNWRVSGFIGGGVVRTWAISTRMASPAIKLSADPGTLNGTRFGVLVSLEGELHPTDEVMLSTWGIYTPAYKWGYFEGKFGIAVPFRNSISILKNAYFGPHMALNLSEGERQPMLGVHATGLEIAGIYLNFTVGYTREKFTGNGVYSIVETSWQF